MLSEPLFVTQQEADAWLDPTIGPLLHADDARLGIHFHNISPLVDQVRTGDVRALPTGSDQTSRKIRGNALLSVLLEHFYSALQEKQQEHPPFGIPNAEQRLLDATVPDMTLEQAIQKIVKATIKRSDDVLREVLLRGKHESTGEQTLLGCIFHELSKTDSAHVADCKKTDRETAFRKIPGGLENAYKQAWRALFYVPLAYGAEMGEYAEDVFGKSTGASQRSPPEQCLEEAAIRILEAVPVADFRHIVRRNIRLLRDLARCSLILFSVHEVGAAGVESRIIRPSREGCFLTPTDDAAEFLQEARTKPTFLDAVGAGVTFCPSEYAMVTEPGGEHVNLTVALHNGVLAEADRWIFPHAEHMITRTLDEKREQMMESKRKGLLDLTMLLRFLKKP